MGSWTELMIEDMPIASSKSYVIPELMLLFRDSDKKIFNRKYSERSKIVWANLSDDHEIEQALEYHCNLLKVKERLNLFGFNFKKLKNNFDFMKEEYIEYNYRLLREENIFSEIIKKINAISFDDYCKYLTFYFNNRYNLTNNNNHLYNIFNNSISMNKDLFTFNYDAREIIILYAELLNNDEKVIQDLTEVTHAGYYDYDDFIVSDCEKIISNSSRASEQIFIFTEGSSDIYILKNSLQILYPHLFDFFVFIDYGSTNLGGGASVLVQLIKAFIGARMPNKIIAIFDSDTAALEAKSSIQNINLPINIKVTQYPWIELLDSYITLGPSGKSNDNIYNLATSIELYLGSDCIKDSSNNEYYPIIWKSYNEKLKKYHGEISHKNIIFSKFKQKIESYDLNNHDQYDWEGLTEIWKHILQLASEM